MSVIRIGAQHVHRAVDRLVVRPLSRHQHDARLHLIAHVQRQSDRAAIVDQPHALAVAQIARGGIGRDAARSTARPRAGAGRRRRKTQCGSGNIPVRSADAAAIAPCVASTGSGCQSGIGGSPCVGQRLRIELQFAGRRAELLAALRSRWRSGRHRATRRDRSPRPRRSRRGTARAGSPAPTCGTPDRSRPCARPAPAPASGSTTPRPAVRTARWLYCM